MVENFDRSVSVSLVQRGSNLGLRDRLDTEGFVLNLLLVQKSVLNCLGMGQ